FPLHVPDSPAAYLKLSTVLQSQQAILHRQMRSHMLPGLLRRETGPDGPESKIQLRTRYRILVLPKRKLTQSFWHPPSFSRRALLKGHLHLPLQTDLKWQSASRKMNTQS